MFDPHVIFGVYVKYFLYSNFSFRWIYFYLNVVIIFFRYISYFILNLAYSLIQTTKKILKHTLVETEDKNKIIY